jgi:hypothetical protein
MANKAIGLTPNRMGMDGEERVVNPCSYDLALQ